MLPKIYKYLPKYISLNLVTLVRDFYGYAIISMDVAKISMNLLNLYWHIHTERIMRRNMRLTWLFYN